MPKMGAQRLAVFKRSSAMYAGECRQSGSLLFFIGLDNLDLALSDEINGHLPVEVREVFYGFPRRRDGSLWAF